MITAIGAPSANSWLAFKPHPHARSFHLLAHDSFPQEQNKPATSGRFRYWLPGTLPIHSTDKRPSLAPGSLPPRSCYVRCLRGKVYCC